MEISRRTRITRPVGVKPGQVQAKRQPLCAIGNRITVNPIKKDDVTKKQALKGDKLSIKPIKNQLVEKFVAKQEEKVVEKEKEKKIEVVKKTEEVKIVKNEEYVAFSSKNLPEGVDDIDKEDSGNAQLVSANVNEIYHYMRHLENKYPIKKNFLEGQPEVTFKMRAVLIDWLVQVHMKFNLLQETLFLTVSVIDRFLQVEKVRRSKLQLVGVAAMFIASKYEEMYAPEVRDFVYITDNTYSKEEILRMEVNMLSKLDYSLGKPLPLHFLRRNSKAGNVDSTMHTLAKYLMELLITEYEFAHFNPSMIAAAALYLSIKLTDEGTWTANLAYYSNYEEAEIMPLVSAICKLLLQIENKKLRAVPRKYASSKLMKISLIPELNSKVVKELASANETSK